MKSTLILASFAAIVASQGIADLPTCSLSCLTTAITGLECGLTDFACSCQKASELTPVVTPCVRSACSDPADQSKTIEVLAGICAAAGFPIEVPEPSATSAVPLPTPTSADPAPEPTTEAPSATSSEAPIETLPSATDEPEYPTATDEPSNYPGMCPPSPLTILTLLTSAVPTHPTDDVPNLPSSSTDHVPHPSSIDTTVPPVSLPSPHSVSIPSVLPPYPTSRLSSVSVPQGTGAPTRTSSGLPEFTGAAAAAQVPMVAAGVFGLAALVL
ncbi:hypothetical protein SVAN01_10284 [Stagonosporopsis vannaccii]|nr:hypothetical protein SVAN01_10284 [Stagonosporopsis vannaccii]